MEHPVGARQLTNLCLSPNATVEPPEGDNLLLLNDILQVLGGLPYIHALDSLGGLSRVLEVNPEVETSGFTRYRLCREHVGFV